MKRLISWLLALTLIVGLLPMSVFAVEVETEDDNADMTVDMWELLAGGSESNPYIPTFTWNETNTEATAVVTIPAGKTMYLQSYQVGGMYMVIGEGEAVLCEAAPRQPYSWTITNDGEAEAEYTITVSYPEGHQMNPKVIEEMSWYFDEVAQAEGDSDGFFYIYTAPADGTITLYFNPVYDDEGNVVDLGTQRDIIVTNNTTYAQYTLLGDGVDNYGLELQVPVAAGDEIIINTAWVQDADGNYYPEATYSWNGNFTYPAGTEQNPINLEWAWSDDGATATASTTTEADGTYYNGTAGMILTVDGEEVAMDEMGVFQLNAGEHNLVLSTPVGAQANPEVIEDMNDYSDSNSLAADGSYYYIWTAPADGTVTLDVTDGANLTVDKLTYTEDSEWPISTQYTLAEPEIDENWNYTGWTVAENLVIEVVAGEQLKIQVNALTDWSTWTTPAIDYTLTGDFEVAEAAPEYVVTVSGITLDMAAELFVSAKYLIPDELLADEGAVLRLEFVNKVTEINIADYIAENGVDSKGRIQVKQSINSGFMNQLISATVVDSNGNIANFTDSTGAVYEGAYIYGVKSYVDQVFSRTGNQALKDAIVALLTYGSYAQVYFSNRGTAGISSEPAYNMLAEYGVSPVDMSAFNLADLTQTMSGTGDSFDGISIRTGSPVLEAAVYMNVQFNASEISEANLGDYTYTLTYTVGSETKTVELDTPTWDTRGRMIFKVENIAAALFDCMYSITITKTATGETYTGQYSVLVYLKTAISSLEGNASKVDDLNLYKSMYYYNQAANAYFGK